MPRAYNEASNPLCHAMTFADPAPSQRYAGLDGLRALAVVLVVVYHLFPASWVRGGFIGVDVFFVISGFLITSLLLTERERTGRIALRAFWTRRARRLLPALALLVIVCGTWAGIVGGDVLVGLGAQVAGAATFAYNWISVATGAGYFETTTPELFRNLWSLSVEEQFYVVWPLLLPLVLLLRPVWARVVAMLAAAGLSALWMAALVGASTDPTRAYFGTDSHAFGILLGVAVALGLRGRLQALHASGGLGRRGAATAGVVGVAAIVAIVVVACIPPTSGVATFPGVLLLASILSATAIVCAILPGSPLGVRLDAAPLRWIGERSYGIYLWHWPVLVLMMAGLSGVGAETGVPVSVGIATLAITLVVAAASYRWLEQPIRRRGFGGALKGLGARLSGTPAVRYRTLAIVTAGLLAAGATTSAIASAPSESSSEAAVAAGARALEDAQAQARAQAQVDAAAQLRDGGAATAAGGGAAPVGGGAGPAPGQPGPGQPSPGPGQPSPAPGQPSPAPGQPSPAPTAVAGSEITAVGDSVMLAAAPALLERYPGIQIDAEVSRSMWSAPGILEGLAQSGQLRPYVVLALGTNGPVDADSLQRAADIVGPERHLILVNAFAPRAWIPGVNQALADFAAGHPGVTIADWSGAIDPRRDELAGDLIHPGAEGGRTYAAMVGDTVQGIEDARAAREATLRSAEQTVTRILGLVFAFGR